jgi:putative ATP-binding cassette transporter
MLASAVCYPATLNICSMDDIAAAMRRVGLDSLVDRLADSDNWEQAIGPSEKQLIGFARLLLHHPEWIFLAEATNALDQTDQHRILDVLRSACGDACIMAIGAEGAFDGFFNTVLRVHADLERA